MYCECKYCKKKNKKKRKIELICFLAFEVFILIFFFATTAGWEMRASLNCWNKPKRRLVCGRRRWLSLRGRTWRRTRWTRRGCPSTWSTTGPARSPASSRSSRPTWVGLFTTRVGRRVLRISSQCYNRGDAAQVAERSPPMPKVVGLNPGRCRCRSLCVTQGSYSARLFFQGPDLFVTYLPMFG